MKTAPVKKALQRLRKLGGETQHSDSVVSYWRTDFAAATGGDYYFSTCVFEDGGASLAANRVGVEENEYFWSHSYKAADFPDADSLLNALTSDTETLLRCATRIRQKRGLLVYSFLCEYFRDEYWQPLAKSNAFRFGGFRFPPMPRATVEYTSPMLLSSDPSTADGPPD